jgi:hypothetical protein
MRWIYFAIIILFVLATLIFALQNRELVTVSFLSLQAGRAARFVDHRGLSLGCGHRRQPVRAAAALVQGLAFPLTAN